MCARGSLSLSLPRTRHLDLEQPSIGESHLHVSASPGWNGPSDEARVSPLELAHVDLSQLQGADGQPLRLDGQSLLPFVRDPSAPSQRSVLFSEFFGPNGPPPYLEGFRTVRDRDFKLIRSLVGQPDQLYDLRGRVFEGEDLLPQGLDSEQQRAYDALSDTLEELLAERPYEGPPRQDR